MTSSYSPEQRQLSDLLELVTWRFLGQPLFHLVPLPFFFLRILILRIFGAKVGFSNRIYPSVKIWLPRMLHIGSCTGIGHGVYLYNKALIQIGDGCVISRNSFICTATHDISSETFELISKSIVIDNNSWIASSCIVLPGIRVREGSVIGAGSVLTKSTLPWHVYAGNPARKLRVRTISSHTAS